MDTLVLVMLRGHDSPRNMIVKILLRKITLSVFTVELPNFRSPLGRTSFVLKRALFL